jgi:hypothetical protein
MKVTIKNFGPIDTITFDMSKGFHLIYGKNSIGKSYSTYCLYCVVKNITNKQASRSYPLHYHGSKSREEHRERIKNLIKKTRNNSGDVKSIVSFANEYVNSRLDSEIIPGLMTSLRNTFSSLSVLKNAYTKENYSIELQLDEETKLTILSDDDGEPYLDPVVLDGTWKFIQKPTKSTKFSLYIDSKKKIGSPTEEKFAQEFLYNLDLFTSHLFKKMGANVKDIYYLPASRSGLYQALSSFTPILAELTQSRFFLNSRKLELPSLSEPLSDYFIDISTIDKKSHNDQYSAIIENFERNILEGSVRYDHEAKKIKYRPFDVDFELDISEVSSMVAELSPIVIFLKHILHHKYSTKPTSIYDDFFGVYQGRNRRSGRVDGYFDIIFIEEPEAHLHPEVQVKLAEIFAELTKHQIIIVMTSHSNYMFNKINNIILKKELNSDNIAVYQLIKGQKGSKCNPEMTIDNEGISDENFVEISRELYQERLDSLED